MQNEVDHAKFCTALAIVEAGKEVCGGQNPLIKAYRLSIGCGLKEAKDAIKLATEFYARNRGVAIKLVVEFYAQNPDLVRSIIVSDILRLT